MALGELGAISKLPSASSLAGLPQTSRQFSGSHTGTSVASGNTVWGGVDSGLSTGLVGRANERVGSQNPRLGLVQGTGHWPAGRDTEPHACPCHWEQIPGAPGSGADWGRHVGPGAETPGHWRLCSPGQVVCPLWASIFCFTREIVTVASPASRTLSEW